MARPSNPTAARRFFVGQPFVAAADALEAWLRSAEPNAEFTYCEAPDPIRGETWARAGELARKGLVTTHHLRRQGGGFRYFVVRTKKPLKRAETPQDRVLADPATDIIFRQLCRAANMGRDCPSDADLARFAGLYTRAQAQQRFQKLIGVGLVESQVAYERGVPKRVVTIVKTGKRTALPEKWANLERAARADCSVAGPSTPTGAGRAANPTYPRRKGGAW